MRFSLLRDYYWSTRLDFEHNTLLTDTYKDFRSFQMCNQTIQSGQIWIRTTYGSYINALNKNNTWLVTLCANILKWNWFFFSKKKKIERGLKLLQIYKKVYKDFHFKSKLCSFFSQKFMRFWEIQKHATCFCSLSVSE